MLRLWPERISLWLMPETGWVQQGSGRRSVAPDVDAAAAARLLHMAEQLLPASGRRGWRTPLDVIVGGEAGRAQFLPWQPRLHGEQEQRRYAEACFEYEQMRSADWAIQAAFRDYGRAGMALAVRRDLIAGLLQLCATRSLRLRSMLPTAASAYWRFKPLRRLEQVLVLDEGPRLTALRYAGGALVELDVQPALGDRELAYTRLMRRCSAMQNAPMRLAYWNGAASPLRDEHLASVWAHAEVRHVAQGAWR